MDGPTPARYAYLLVCAAIIAAPGCAAQGLVSQRAKLTSNAIPAYRLPQALSGASKRNQVPIDFTLLRRPPVREHVIGPQDVLGIYIQDILAVENQLANVYYPPEGTRGAVESPSVGHPVVVRADGTVALPLVGTIQVAGLTLPEAVGVIQKPYLDKDILNEQRGLVTVDLIRCRTVKVFVVREDTGPTDATLLRRDSQVLAKRGSADALDLPVFENDILHALSLTGGLPGADGFNEVWVLRGNRMTDMGRMEVMANLESGRAPEDMFVGVDRSFVRIPLRVCPGQEIPFTADDVTLHDGDVVFIESREVEYFMTGGLINGGKFPLPRDHDVDVIEALAIANANVNGPAGDGTATNFRGPGNVIAPTQAVIVRQLDTGEQIKILVDLKIAMNDPRERIAIMPRDLIVLQYKPTELFANIALNFVNFGYAIPSN